MPRKPTGKPAGRPRKAAADEAAAEVQAGRATTGDAAVGARVHPATVKRRLAERRAGKGAPAKSGGADGSWVVPPPSGSLAASQGAAIDGASSDRRAALLALLAEALEAAPALLDALPLDAAELGRRLADPGLVGEGDLDELAILGRVQARLEDDLRRLAVDAVVARKGVVGTLVQIAATAARIRAGRPTETEEPEVIAGRMVEALRDQALAKVREGIEARRAAA